MKIFGILNLTPDSFSDGGQYNLTQNALNRAEQLILDGAHAIDIGAESTRPGATPLTSQQELERLLPFLYALSSDEGTESHQPAERSFVSRAPQARYENIILSIDTYHPETAERVIKYNNVQYLNDVSGFNNPEMIKIAAECSVNIIVMHSLTIPADKNIIVTTPIIPTLQSWIESKFTQLTNAKISPDKIIFDPGIGFGKSAEQSIEIIEKADILAETCHKLGAKIYYGHSRKSFLGGAVESRDEATSRISAQLYNKGVDFIRVHDVKANLESTRYTSHILN